jgi:hypothetical protein
MKLWEPSKGTSHMLRNGYQRIAHLQDFPLPKTINQLRRFLGMLNFHRRFLPQAATDFCFAYLDDMGTTHKVNDFFPFNLDNPFGRTRPWDLLILNRNEYQK